MHAIPYTCHLIFLIWASSVSLSLLTNTPPYIFLLWRYLVVNSLILSENVLTLILFFFFFNCSGFCHTLKWISHGFTCVPHPDPPSHLPLHPIPLGLPSAPGWSACLMHLDSVGEGESGMFQENSIETCILSRVKQITNPHSWEIVSLRLQF